MQLPALRPLDLFPVKEDGMDGVVLRDTEGIAEKVLVLSAVDYLIAVHLDGRRDAAAVQAAIAERFDKALVPAARIEELAKALDENLMLDSPRYRARLAELLERFRAAPARKAAHAGGGYAEKAPQLNRQLNAYFAPPRGPGLDGVGAAATGRLVGLVAPHIDFHRGGPAYAWAYREVLRSGLADLYVVLGVAHASPPTPFVATRKDYDTPLGRAVTDAGLAGRLAEGAPYDLFADELVHRREHSIEFQAVFLRWVRGKLGGDFRALPILCSSRGREHAPAVLKRLAALLKGYPGKVCLVAGVDLAHVGPRFGDDEPVTEKTIAWVEAADRESLDRVLALDPEGFRRSVEGDGDKRKVCGAEALHAFTWLLRELHPKTRGELLRYGHAADPAGGEVSFASLAFRA